MGLVKLLVIMAGEKSITDNYRKYTSKNPIQRFLINKFFKTLLKEAERLKPQSILDVGCGEGFVLEKFRENKIGKELVGIDFSERAIQIGRKLHPSLSLRPGTAYHIPFKANSFDLVICSEVLEHLQYPEKAMAELERVTKKYCIISVPHEPWFMLANLLRGKNISRLGNDIEHVQRWSRHGINVIAGKYFYVTTLKGSFPWTIVVAKK